MSWLTRWLGVSVEKVDAVAAPDPEPTEHQKEWEQLLDLRDKFGGWIGFSEAFLDGKLQPYIDAGLSEHTIEACVGNDRLLSITNKRLLLVLTLIEQRLKRLEEKL